LYNSNVIFLLCVDAIFVEIYILFDLALNSQDVWNLNFGSLNGGQHIANEFLGTISNLCVILYLFSSSISNFIKHVTFNILTILDWIQRLDPSINPNTQSIDMTKLNDGKFRQMYQIVLSNKVVGYCLHINCRSTR